MSGTFCPWCGAPDCGRCHPSPYEAPRHCRGCGRRLRLTVHPTGWEARCRRCRTVSTSAEAPRTVKTPEGG